MNDSEKLLNDIYLDLFLNRLLRLQRISQLEQLIDSSLDARNERAFYAYTEELNSLREEQNS
ncbi:MAG: IDEAL domain-containing protein [Lysinibacillus sp.]